MKTLLESFRYPRKGPGMMWETTAQRIIEQGGQIRKGHSLTSLDWCDESKLWSISTTQLDGEQEILKARHVISSAPITDLATAFACPLATAKNALALRYRDFITVALITKAGSSFPDNWIYIYDPSVKVGRIQNFLSWSPEMVPAGYACFGLEYFCFEGDGLWTSSDADLIALARREIDQIGLIREEDVIDATIVRQPKAYPVYDESYQANVEAIRAELEEKYPTLHLVGRNGMHKYNNQDHAMMTAMLTVENIKLGKKHFDVWLVNEDAEYSEVGLSGVAEVLKSERLVPRKVV